MRERSAELLPRLVSDWRVLFLSPGSIWLPIVAMSAIALGAVLFNEASVKRIRADSEHQARLMEMRTKVFELRTAMLDAETGQRGYLLTRDADYLDPYRNAMGKTALLTATLMAASGDDLALLAEVKKVDALRADKLGEVAATIKMVEQGVQEMRWW